MKKQKVVYFVLFTTSFFVIAFQNCGPRIGGGVRPVISDPACQMVNCKAAFFRFGSSSEIQSVFWDVRERTCDSKYESYATSTNDYIEIPWEHTDDIFSVNAFMILSGQSCISYRNWGFDLPSKTSSMCHLMATVPSVFISTTSSQDSSPKKYFPVNSTVNFLANYDGRIYDSNGLLRVETSEVKYQWQLERLFETKETIQIESDVEETFSHTFVTPGLYKVSVTATEDDSSVTDSSDILIGYCEGEENPISVILWGFFLFENAGPEGSHTPKWVKAYPVFDSVRPVDSSSSSSIKMVTNDIEDSNNLYSHLYKYDRTSSTKYIAIHVHNADQCFFDDEPVETTEHPGYKRRSDLQPLASCRGKAYDMESLDTDIAQCTEDVFVVEATKEGLVLNSKTDTQISRINKASYVFYKYCGANSQYCYFGREDHRPQDHHCSP